MTREERKAWLASLKVGDEVAMQCRCGAGFDWSRGKVVRIENREWIVADRNGCEREFDSDGDYDGGDGYVSHAIKLVPMTDKIRAHCIDRDLRRIEWDKVPAEVRAQVVRIVQGGDPAATRVRDALLSAAETLAENAHATALGDDDRAEAAALRALADKE